DAPAERWQGGEYTARWPDWTFDAMWCQDLAAPSASGYDCTTGLDTIAVEPHSGGAAATLDRMHGSVQAERDPSPTRGSDQRLDELNSVDCAIVRKQRTTTDLRVDGGLGCDH